MPEGSGWGACDFFNLKKKKKKELCSVKHIKRKKKEKKKKKIIKKRKYVYSTYMYLLEKKMLHLSGPVQFKPMLFKGQLFFFKNSILLYAGV